MKLHRLGGHMRVRTVPFKYMCISIVAGETQALNAMLECMSTCDEQHKFERKKKNNTKLK